MAFSHYAIWELILAFYIFEHLKLVKDDAVLASYATDGSIDIKIASVPFLLNNRQLVVLPLLSFNKIVVLGSMNMRWRIPSLYRSLEREKLRRLMVQLEPLLRVEPYVAAWYFMALPAITYVEGLVPALVLFVAAQFAILVYFWRHVFRFRGLQGDKLPCRLCLALELIVVPGIIPALSKRLALSHIVKHDAPHLFVGALPERRRQEVLDVVRFRLGRMRDNNEISEPMEVDYLSGKEWAK